MNELTKAYIAVRKQQKELIEIAVTVYPPGSTVTWMHSGLIRTGTVISHLRQGHVLYVQRPDVRKRSRVSIWQVIDDSEGLPIVEAAIRIEQGEPNR